jgi:hypothetical protein
MDLAGAAYLSSGYQHEAFLVFETRHAGTTDHRIS